MMGPNPFIWRVCVNSWTNTGVTSTGRPLDSQYDGAAITKYGRRVRLSWSAKLSSAKGLLFPLGIVSVSWCGATRHKSFAPPSDGPGTGGVGAATADVV